MSVSSLRVTTACATLLAVAVAPAQDECITATVVVAGTNGPFDSTGATTSAPPWPCGIGGNDVWYTYTPTACGDLTIDTCGAAFDTVMQVFAARNGCGALEDLGCNDDNFIICTPPTSSHVTVPNVIVGVPLAIRVGGWVGATGVHSVNITLTPSPPLPNDDCSGALAVPLGRNGEFVTGCATNSLPAVSCLSGVGRDVWYSYTAACTAPHTFHVCESDYDTAIEVRTACGGPVLGCNDDNVAQCGTGSGSALTVPLTLGATYFVRVAGVAGDWGTHWLNVSTGTNTGSSSVTTVSQCPTSATLTLGGNRNIGGLISIDVTGATGLAFCGFGFPPTSPIPLPCGCDVITDGSGSVLGDFRLGTSRNLDIPCDPVFIGVAVDIQGVDAFPTTGGCVFAGVSFGLTDIHTVVIG